METFATQRNGGNPYAVTSCCARYLGSTWKLLQHSVMHGGNPYAVTSCCARHLGSTWKHLQHSVMGASARRPQRPGISSSTPTTRSIGDAGESLAQSFWATAVAIICLCTATIGSKATASGQQPSTRGRVLSESVDSAGDVIGECSGGGG